MPGGLPETLIEAVRKFGCLWNVSSKSFKDNKAKENAWKAVAQEVRNASVFVMLVKLWLINRLERTSQPRNALESGRTCETPSLGS